MIFGNGIRLAKVTSVKRSITYKEITVAIGILVAVVVAMSLWMGFPGMEVSGVNPHPVYDLPSSARSFVLEITTGALEERSSPLQGI